MQEVTEKQFPDGWHMVKFGDMAKHISKRVEPSKTDLNIYVGLEHLDPDSLRIIRHGVPSDVAGQKLLVRKGQIIFGKRRAYQRKVAVADWDCICSAHAMVLEANPETVSPEFFSFFMQSDVFMNRAVAISEGSLSPTIKWKVLSEQKFLLPNIDIQLDIIKSLRCIEGNLYKAEEFYQTTKVILERIIDKYTTYDRKDDLPAGWRRVRLKDLCSINSKLLSNKTPKDKKIEYIDISSVSYPGQLAQTQCFLFSDAPSRARRVLKEGNIIVSTVRPNHRATLYVTDEQSNCISSTGFSVLECELKLARFIYFFTLSKQFSHSLTNLAIGTSFPAVTNGDILAQKIVLPPDEKVEEICEMLSHQELVFNEAKERAFCLQQLKKAYLNNLLQA